MPLDDYTSTSRGSLKLKGSAPTGIKKKKKKDKSKLSTSTEGGESALEKALGEEDATAKPVNGGVKGDREDKDLDEAQLRELETRDGDGKTASERQYEEMRRKRVCQILSPRAY
jgi:protein FAM32A